MIDKIPKGKLIGTMEAPLPWIFSHTTRFVGVVRITIQDGEGFILIDKGKVRSYYFRHGKRVLTGHAAQDYFGTQPLIHFSMYKLTPEEFSSALIITGSDGAPVVVNEPRAEPHLPTTSVIQSQSVQEPEPGAPVVVNEPRAEPHLPTTSVIQSQSVQEPEPGAPVVVNEPKAEPHLPTTSVIQSQSVQEPEPEAALSKPVPAAPSVPVSPQTTSPAPKTRPPEIPQHSVGQVSKPGHESVSSAMQHPAEGVTSAVPRASDSKDLPVEKISKKQTKTEPDLSEPRAEERLPDADLRMIAQTMLGRIKTLPGVSAALIFNRDTHFLSIGSGNLDTLMTSAEDMLMTVSQLGAVTEWGSFVQMTIQMPSGNVIIAPFFDEYLCILTSPDINLGQIRRILREIKTRQVQ